ncbi:MAG: hypothetical protein LBE12_02285 [Planctomycetaceae bacterium]|nr:hypothetical protein [Planctomycetaceae bacterium]
MFTCWLLKWLKIGGDFGILWSIVHVNYPKVGDVSPIHHSAPYLSIVVQLDAEVVHTMRTTQPIPTLVHSLIMPLWLFLLVQLLHVY